MHVTSETQEMQRRVICGHGFVVRAHGGRLFRGGIDLVALKMEKVVAIMESTISEQLKFTPRRKNFAARTRIFDFCGYQLVKVIECLSGSVVPSPALVLCRCRVRPSQDFAPLGRSDS